MVFTFTPKPWGYSDTPVYPAKMVQGDESLWYPRSQHGRPQFYSVRKAKELRGQVFEAIRQIQGYRPDWLCFTELQDNGNPHFHGVLSNVNLTHKSFEPVVIKKDRESRRHIVFQGMEGIAWELMGQASCRLYGGADGNLTAGHYFARDILRADKGRPEIEASPLWSKRGRRGQELNRALELNRKVWGGLVSSSSVDAREGKGLTLNAPCRR